MKTNKQIFYSLLILFEIIFFVKIIISFLHESPYILPDETCVLIRARYFIDNLKMATCDEITGYPVGSPMPLLSFLVSPVYLFTGGSKAYSIIMAIHAFFVSSLVFPLFAIFKRFIKNTKAIFLVIPFILFLPSIVIYEQTTMTESLFVILNIWFLYFYINSFENRRNKIIAFVFAVLAIFARPFGFITILAAFINEIILSRKKKYVFLYGSLLIVIPVVFILVFYPSMPQNLMGKFLGLSDPSAFKYFLIAGLNQINSLTLSGILISFAIFSLCIFKKDSFDLNKIRYFLLSFIGLNFIISTQHIYGYFLEGNNPQLITRYINMSVIFIDIFAVIFFLRYKKISFNLKQIIVLTVALLPLVFFKLEGIKHTLNLDFSVFYNTHLHLYGLDLISPKKYLLIGIFVLSFLLLGLLMKGSRKIFSILTLVFFSIYSVSTMVWIVNFSSKSDIVRFFEKENKTITLLLKEFESTYTVTLLHLRALTNNQIYMTNIRVKDEEDAIKMADLLERSDYIKQSDYVLSTIELDLPLVFTSGTALNVYFNDKKNDK